MDIMNYVRPELLVVAVVLYFLGMWLKHSGHHGCMWWSYGRCRTLHNAGLSSR